MKPEEKNPLASMAANASKAEAMLKQLASAPRLLVLCNLVSGEKSAGELVEITGLSHSALSQHLAKMLRSKLVAREKRGKNVYYRITSVEVQAVLSTLYLIYCR